MVFSEQPDHVAGGFFVRDDGKARRGAKPVEKTVQSGVPFERPREGDDVPLRRKRSDAGYLPVRIVEPRASTLPCASRTSSTLPFFSSRNRLPYSSLGTHGKSSVSMRLIPSLAKQLRATHRASGRERAGDILLALSIATRRLLPRKRIPACPVSRLRQVARFSVSTVRTVRAAH